jgi:hypothetical protein
MRLAFGVTFLGAASPAVLKSFRIWSLGFIFGIWILGFEIFVLVNEATLNAAIGSPKTIAGNIEFVWTL